MLSLTNNSICDVCAEEYTHARVPHCIPCGHILCKACCNTIIEKTHPGRTPVCPFCRLNFASDGIRKLRLDLNASLSGPSTPSARLASVEANEDVRGVLKEDGMPKTDRDRASLRSDARHLEDRVARIAAKRCSVNEVTAVLKDVDACLRAWDASDEQPMSLILSSALLRAILTNYHAHDQATKAMKGTEANLRAQVNDLENAAGNLQAELRKIKSQQTQKAQECQSLRVELNRYKIKAAASSLNMPSSGLGLSTTSFGTAGDTVSSDMSRPTSPISPYSDTRSLGGSSRSQTPSVLGSPLRHLVALPPSVPGSNAQTPATSPMASPPTSPGYVSSPRYATVSSSTPGHYRPPSASGHRSTHSATFSTSSAASIDRSRTPVASVYPTVPRPTSPTPVERSRRPSISFAAPQMLRSASDEERDLPQHVPAPSRTKALGSSFVQRWLPGASDARAPSAPPAMFASRPSHGRSPSMQAHITKASTTAPLSASAAARAVRA